MLVLHLSFRMFEAAALKVPWLKDAGFPYNKTVIPTKSYEIKLITPYVSLSLWNSSSALFIKAVRLSVVGQPRSSQLEILIDLQLLFIGPQERCKPGLYAGAAPPRAGSIREATGR